MDFVPAVLTGGEHQDTEGPLKAKASVFPTRNQIQDFTGAGA